MHSELFAPFYIGQKVVAVDAVPTSAIKNGTVYTVNSCDYAESGNPISPKGMKYWYVGVQGHHNRLRPSIFAPIPEIFQSITISEVIEIETTLISSN